MPAKLLGTLLRLGVYYLVDENLCQLGIEAEGSRIARLDAELLANLTNSLTSEI